MGICASTMSTNTQGQLLITYELTPTIKVINSVDGSLKEFEQPIKTSEVLSGHPDTFFLCNSEEIDVDCHVPQVTGTEELQPGQLYFILPISMSKGLLSLHELCLLAIQASKALKRSAEMKEKESTASFSDRRKSKRNARRNHKVDFQLALKKLG